MGTNFYIRGMSRSDDPNFHLGKRSASGLFCWTCRVTLCQEGERGIHESKSSWHLTCPSCGAAPTTESLEQSAAGRELGFNKSLPGKKTGVSSCCSFTWAINPLNLEQHLQATEGCPHCNHAYEDKEKIIEDEYGALFTLADFRAVLEECPIRNLSLIGQHFF